MPPRARQQMAEEDREHTRKVANPDRDTQPAAGGTRSRQVPRRNSAHSRYLQQEPRPPVGRGAGSVLWQGVPGGQPSLQRDRRKDREDGAHEEPFHPLGLSRVPSSL